MTNPQDRFGPDQPSDGDQRPNPFSRPVAGQPGDPGLQQSGPSLQQSGPSLQQPGAAYPTGATLPPYGGYSPGPQLQSGAVPHGSASFTGADFPAPEGVRPVTETHGPVAVASRPKGRLGAMLVAASLAAVIGAGAGIGTYEYATDQAASGTSISVTTVPAASSPVLDGTVSAAAQKIEPSVVTITVQAGQSGDIGTGVVLDTSGHILTNNHVVEAAAQGGTITVSFHDGTSAKATIVGTSVTNDLAVLKVSGVDNLTPAVFAKSSSVQVGQSVVAAGAPLGLSETITSGIVSNTARPVRSGSNDDAVYLAVQTDTAINPGNSGGPLVNLNGAVLGINSSIASTGSSQDSSSQSGSIGIGFAIPSDVAVRVASDLISTGTSKNAAMGVTVAGSDDTMSTSSGVALQSVVSGGAADKAGLVAGDVVTKVDNFSTTSADGLIAATRFYAPGTKVSVTYDRGGSTSTVEVTLGSS